MDVDDDTATGMDSKAAARSCTTCSKAKAKCVRRPGQEICERCGDTSMNFDQCARGQSPRHRELMCEVINMPLL